jgi:PhnB protein
MRTVGESPMAASMPAQVHNNVLHSTLESDGFLLMASDMMESGAAVKGNTMTLCLVCKSKEEIESAYSKLAAGGTVGHPLKEEFFGTFGDLQDKYGMSWMLQFNANPMS